LAILRFTSWPRFGGPFFSDRARLKQLLQPVQQGDQRYKNGADPISLATSDNMMRHTRRPMLGDKISGRRSVDCSQRVSLDANQQYAF
jgi:hypothetical protein